MLYVSVDEEVVAQVLGLQEQEAPAPSQEAQIDLSTVFNDFFTGNIIPHNSNKLLIFTHNYFHPITVVFVNDKL